MEAPREADGATACGVVWRGLTAPHGPARDAARADRGMIPAHPRTSPTWRLGRVHGAWEQPGVPGFGLAGPRGRGFPDSGTGTPVRFIHLLGAFGAIPRASGFGRPPPPARNTNGGRQGRAPHPPPGADPNRAGPPPCGTDQYTDRPSL